MKHDFENQGELIPAIIQDDLTGRVLMLGYMNLAALEKTLKEGKVTFYSRSKQRLWTKGETSGNYLLVKRVLIDCDGDAYLVKVIPTGFVCHEGTETCFKEESAKGFLYRLEQVVTGRKKNPMDGSYTTKLFGKGIDRIAQKVGEEAVEVIIAAKGEDGEALRSEVADLLFHLLVLLEEKGVGLEEVEGVLMSRQPIPVTPCVPLKGKKNHKCSP